MERATLNQLVLANSLAVLTAALYVLLAIIALVSPSAFQLLFNAQFFGADAASLLRHDTLDAKNVDEVIRRIREGDRCNGNWRCR
jgi:hypothetical protein